MREVRHFGLPFFVFVARYCCTVCMIQTLLLCWKQAGMLSCFYRFSILTHKGTQENRVALSLLNFLKREDVGEKHQGHREVGKAGVEI